MRAKDWLDLILCACLSMLGGLGRLLSVKNKKPIKMSELTRNAFVSLSIGMGIFLLVYGTIPKAKNNQYLVFAAGYFAGWAGPWFINGIIDKFAGDKGIKKPPNDDN